MEELGPEDVDPKEIEDRTPETYPGGIEDLDLAFEFLSGAFTHDPEKAGDMKIMSGTLDEFTAVMSGLVRHIELLLAVAYKIAQVRLAEHGDEREAKNAWNLWKKSYPLLDALFTSTQFGTVEMNSEEFIEHFLNLPIVSVDDEEEKG